MRPIIIGVGGAHSGAGKTTLAVALLRHLTEINPLWGAIKYTKTAIYCSMIDDIEVLSKEDKDTERLLSSGAERVLWVQSPASELGEVLPMAVEKLSDLKGIVVEGNSAIEFLRPDIIIFIFGSDSGRIKESARRVLEMADVVVCKGSNELIVTSGQSNRSQPSVLSLTTRLSDCQNAGLSELGNEDFIACIAEMVEKKEKIRSAIKEKAIDGRLPCPLARKIAEELSVSYKEVGEVADRLEIKIIDCELGCF
ncbi:MAG: molybdopterin-guanine dinucleotide biosynthesis protein MobB [Thermodesulfovibrionales bacterium]